MTALEDVEDKVVSAVVQPTTWIIVVPLFVVDRYPHFRWIAIVQTIAAAIVLIGPEVLWIVHVGVVIKAVPIMNGSRGSPRLAKRLLRLTCLTASDKYNR